LRSAAAFPQPEHDVETAVDAGRGGKHNLAPGRIKTGDASLEKLHLRTLERLRDRAPFDLVIGRILMELS